MKLGTLLDGLRLDDYVHVVVRRKLKSGYEPLGGGWPGQVCRRFGGLEVVRCSIVENIFILYVESEEE